MNEEKREQKLVREEGPGGKDMSKRGADVVFLSTLVSK